MKKFFALLLAVVMCISLTACGSKDDESSIAAAESASKASSEAEAASKSAASKASTTAPETTTTAAETTTTAAAPTYCKNLLSKYSSFTKMTCSKGSLVDKGDSYEVYVNIDKDGSSIGGETVRISKGATVTWFNGESTTQLSLSSYLNQVSTIRMWKNNFEENQVFACDGNGHIVAFFDGLFS